MGRRPRAVGSERSSDGQAAVCPNAMDNGGIMAGSRVSVLVSGTHGHAQALESNTGNRNVELGIGSWYW